MKKVRIIGVPEHFNLPWHLAIEEGAFEQRGIDLEWTDIPEGTGRMCQMLRENETDIALILTEGIVKDITAGNPSKIVQTFVQTPLKWGIHVNGSSNLNSISDLQNKKVAISRFGSGSHLMAFVNAQNQGWETNNLSFEIIHNVDGAVNALQEGTADYFMWEHFMTKPLVDKGIFKRVGDCPTPWPCFVVAATDKFLNENGSIIRHILEVINTYTEEFKIIPSIDRTIANTFEQQLEDVQEWLKITQWSQQQLSAKELSKVQDTLQSLNLIDEKLPTDKILN
ncbi:substrate-binding domain-containing protein [Zhouia sp. PK063]|uniref:substrate-binding domain-containing protein n=1 Tax=Zhouia sp. PK063 TaxID=3373602 RepID=UPI0037A64AFC